MSNGLSMSCEENMEVAIAKVASSENDVYKI